MDHGHGGRAHKQKFVFFFAVRSFVRCPIVVRHSLNWCDMRKMAILHGTARVVYANKQVRAPSLITFSIYNVHELWAAVQSRVLTNCYGEYAIFFFFPPIGLCILSYSIPRWTAAANRQRHKKKKSIWFDVDANAAAVMAPQPPAKTCIAR